MATSKKPVKKSSKAPRKKSPGIWSGLYGPVEVRRIQPYQALKTYICPGCQQEIPKGMGHNVAVPQDAPDLRRHWHYACWDREAKSHPST